MELNNSVFCDKCGETLALKAYRVGRMKQKPIPNTLTILFRKKKVAILATL
jgi:hypothetical protein